uniref:Unannotated protein n=1 Tax=freshwater metagenome TaxID=449393 RepID=A0A6J7PG06_9ZZZZ
MSSEKPITTSGIVSGSTMIVLMKPLPRNRYFTSASAMSVPRHPASTVTIAPTSRLFSNARFSSGYLKGSFHAFSEKWFHS